MIYCDTCGTAYDGHNVSDCPTCSLASQLGGIVQDRDLDQTVFVVSDGEYSDWGIVGIFASREGAASYKKQCCLTNDIQSYKLNDVPQIPQGRHPYVVYMRRDGTATDVFTTLPSSDDKRFELQSYEMQLPAGERYQQLLCCLFARSTKHAVKIANERRAMLIANNEWLVDEPKAEAPEPWVKQDEVVDDSEPEEETSEESEDEQE